MVLTNERGTGWNCRSGSSGWSATVLTDGTALVTATDAEERPRASFGVNNKGEPVVATLDAKGKLNDLNAE